MDSLIKWLEETSEGLAKNRNDIENQRIEAVQLGFILQGRAEAISAVLEKCKEIDNASTESGPPEEKKTVNT